MNKLTKLFALVFVLNLALLGGYAFATETVMVYHPSDWNSFEASYLIGHMVYGPGHYDLGQISDLVIDETNGRVALVVLSDVPGFWAKKVAIPYSLLTRDEGGGFMINFPPDSEIGFSTGFFHTPYAKAMAPGEVDGVIDASWVNSVYTQFGQAPYWTETEGEPGMEVFTSGGFVGAECQLGQGGVAGKVDDFVIDSSDGHIAFLVLSDVSGRNDMVAVPFNAASLKGENTCALDITDDKLASAPIFDESTNLENRGYTEGVYRYYGVQPYWTEDEMR